VSPLNRLNAYRETKIKTASQGKLILMLYDGAIGSLKEAAEHLEKNDKKLDVVNNQIVKAQDMITELMVSLDFDRGGEIAKGLFSLYMYFNRQLMDANLRKDPSVLREVQNHMSELRDAWAQIAKNNRDNNENVSGGVNIAG
jgi:flagellar secretion chaperone FliS